jgi:Ca2+-binding EF-hand superfamily protein
LNRQDSFFATLIFCDKNHPAGNLIPEGPSLPVTSITHMKSKTMIVPALALGLGLSGLRAEEAPRWKQMDKDGDGKISQSEAPPAAWERLSKLDKDGDGSISPQEMAAMRPGGPGAPGGPDAFFKMMDKDTDGKITSSEAGERWERLGKADKDGDGGVSREELAAVMKAAAGAGAGPGGPGGPGGRPNPQEFFAKMDKDGNGGITEDEAPAEVWSRMSKADANSDGKVTPEEMRTAKGGGGAGPGQGPKNGGAGQTPKRPPVES